MVRVELWFGLEQHQSNWTAREKSEGDFAVLAETVRYWLQQLRTIDFRAMDPRSLLVKHRPLRKG